MFIFSLDIGFTLYLFDDWLMKGHSSGNTKLYQQFIHPPSSQKPQAKDTTPLFNWRPNSITIPATFIFSQAKKNNDKGGVGFSSKLIGH